MTSVTNTLRFSRLSRQPLIFAVAHEPGLLQSRALLISWPRGHPVPEHTDFCLERNMDMTHSRFALLCLLSALVLTLAGCGSSPGQRPSSGSLAQEEAGQTLEADWEADHGRPVDTASVENATIMVYMIGSDLESDGGLGTKDLEEMLRADLGSRVNLVIQTMGCQQWHNDAVSSATAQRFTVEEGALVCQAPDLGQLDSTDPATLRDFISYCAANYPAQRNILILWDHGAGPVYGFGYDEFRPAGASLTLDELQSALDQAGVSFDFIGFDACLMGCLETCWALRDYGDYMICSEDFVSGYGWEYQYWLTELGDDVSISTEELGATIVDTYVTESEQAGDPGVMALIDLSQMDDLYQAWLDFAYANQSRLTALNYSWPTEITRRSLFAEWFGEEEDSPVMEDYYITDLMALASTLDTPQSAPLAQVLSRAVVYSAANDQDSDYTGLAVTLPYGNPELYTSLAEIYTRCGFDAAYVSWLARFANTPGAAQFYQDWTRWSQRWDNSSQFGGWAAYESGSGWRDQT